MTSQPTRIPFWKSAPRRNPRLDRELYSIEGQCCFLTVCTAKRARIFANHDFAGLACSLLLELRFSYGCEIEAYCVMPDHIHIVGRPAKSGSSVLTFMDRFKGRCSHDLHKRGWTGPVWQRRFYDHLIREYEDVGAVVGYVVDNPVRAGLSTDAETFEWSGTPDPVWTITERSRFD